MEAGIRQISPQGCHRVCKASGPADSVGPIPVKSPRKVSGCRSLGRRLPNIRVGLTAVEGRPIALDYRRANHPDGSLTPRRGVSVPGMLARRCFSDEAPRLRRTPLRLSAVGQGGSPCARPGMASEAQAGIGCTRAARLGCNGSPNTRPLPPVQEPRWSVTGVPLSREFAQSSARSRRLPRVDKADLKNCSSSFPRRLFVARKSLAIFNISPGVKGGVLSKRMLVEISFPYLAQKCDLCEVNLETAAICIAHLPYAARGKALVGGQGPIPKRRMWSAEEVDTLQTLRTEHIELADTLETAYRPPYKKPQCWRIGEFKRWSKMGPQGFGISLFEGDKRYGDCVGSPVQGLWPVSRD
ncbi:unnamed protein product [Arctogadus glacialis]